uniref:Tripartite motif containing 35-30 n=1 Tax=Poecilia mexicana TaxID=48701 RepID=A0A3B3XMS9_9TELE
MVKDDPWVGTWRPHRPRGLISAQYGTPGPKYVLPGLTGANNHDVTKPKAPAYSISARSKVTNADCSPGPKYMLPPNITRFGKDGTPAFSIHGRPKPFTTFIKPKAPSVTFGIHHSPYTIPFIVNMDGFF